MQQIFNFHKPERFDWGDFIESEENRSAILHLAKWPNWNNHGMIIHGDPGTGKTHLAALWAETASAVYILRESLNHNPRDLFENECNFVIDNFDDFLYLKNYDWMFHFFNIANEKNRFFLILSRFSPSLWNIGLQDLRSRLSALPVVHISTPDDELLSQIARKIAKDLGITISDSALTHILNTVGRDVDSIKKALRTLDKISLQRKKNISAIFVKDNLKT